MAAALLPASAPQAHAASGPEYFGVNLQTIGAITDQARVRGELAAGRMTVHRYEVRWHLVEPSAPRNGVHTYQWNATDAMVREMARSGLRLAPLFRFSPGWVHRVDPTKWGGVDVLPPARYGDFAELVASFARRYGPGGEFWAANPAVPYRPTQTYEIWNEINLDEYAWNHDADPETYAALLAVVRPALKAVQPGALMLGSLAWQRRGPGVYADYVADLATAGGLALLDAMAYHPYAPDAQATFDLVVQLRRELEAAGAPSMPIYANEAGQEAVVTNPDGTLVPNRAPARFGHDLFPSDEARAATLAFAGEALAASDCGVEQFIPYAVAGSEDDSLPLTEGFMGLFRRGSGAPTQSALALQRASRRWASRFDAGGPGAPAERLSLCHPERPAPASALIFLPTRFTFPSVGCVATATTYDGNPLESAYLRLFDRSGVQVAESRSDAFGSASACLPEVIRGQAFHAVVSVRGAARSTVVACDEPGGGCPPGAVVDTAERSVSMAELLHPPLPTPASQAPPAAPAPPAPTSCAWRLDTTPRSFVPQRGARPVGPIAARVRRQTRGVGTQRFSVRADCPTAAPGAELRVVLTARRKGSKAHRKLRVLRLRNGARRVVAVAGVRRGDVVAVVRYATTSPPQPQLRAIVIAGAQECRPASVPCGQPAGGR